MPDTRPGSLSNGIPAVPDIHQRLLAGGEAAEVGCGAGQCIIPVAMAYPNSRFFGYDVDQASIDRARRKAAQAGVADRVTLERIGAEQLSLAARFDLVMAFNCIHDMAQPRGVLAAICRAVKPDGAALWSEAHAGDRMEENFTPQGRTMYASSTMHCMTVSLAQGGEGLGLVIGADRAARDGSRSRFHEIREVASEKSGPPDIPAAPMNQLRAEATCIVRHLFNFDAFPR